MQADDLRDLYRNRRSLKPVTKSSFITARKGYEQEWRPDH